MNEPTASRLSVHIISHTHWDREWYLPVGRFRQRLVALVDELLDDPPPSEAGFLLDGQAIVLDDYLSVRPDRRAELSAMLRDRRLEAGPWYVLADELIPGGEALVRNLLAGRRSLRALRADAPPVLYCPDSFGHPATLPLLANGFGLEAIILWRGYGGSRFPAGDAAWWEAPDRSRALLLHLPPDGYEFGSNLPAEQTEARTRWRRTREVLASRSRLGVVLVQNGADHHARQARHAEAVAALIAAAQPDDARASSLREFVGEALRRASGAELPTVRGELRDSYGYSWTLQGTYAARAAQKRTNAQVERLLVRDTEPWAALARHRRRESRRALLDASWRAVLECHPHDTLCGCSIDAVARAAEVRWDDARAQAEGIRQDSLLALIDHDPVDAHLRRNAWTPVSLIRNPAARTRRGVAWLRLETFLADVGVGPASAGQHLEIPRELPPLALPIPHQVLSEQVGHSRTESPRHYPDNDLVVIRDVVALTDEVPGCGLVPVPLEPAPGRTNPMPPPDLSVRIDGRTMRNARLAVTVDADGHVVLATPDGSRTAPDLLGVECRRDAGDLYTASLREHAPAPRVVATRVLHEGPLHAAMAVEYDIPSPAGGEASSLTATLSLTGDEPFVRIAIDGDHRGRDQRLRLLVRTGVAQGAVWADAAFGAVERLPIEVTAEEAAREQPPPTAPLHRYVSVFGEHGGATLYSDGLAEYEAMPDGTIGVTLLRAVGELSRHDLPERPGNAGWPTPVPEAQSPGRFAARLALYLHAGRRDTAAIDAVERTADDVLLPLAGDTLRSALRVPPVVHGATLHGTGLAFSTMKESEDGEWMVLRCVNLAEHEVAGFWQLGSSIREARVARLDETVLQPLAVEGGEIVRFTAPPRGVVTILVR